MKAQKAVTTEERTLEQVLDEVPSWWSDPDAGGSRGPERCRLSWRIACMGGTMSQERQRLQIMQQALVVQLKKREIHEKRGEIQAELEAAGLIANYEKEIPRLTLVVQAAGPWANAGMAVLTSAVGAAEFELTEAREVAARYDHPGVEVPEEITKRVKDAERALGTAAAAREAMLIEVDKDRAALARLHARRVA